MDMKKLLVYMPMTFDRVSTKAFRSFLEMIWNVKIVLNDQYDIQMLEPYICDKFPIDLNRNHAFNAVQHTTQYQADYIMCCDGDQVFKKDTILRLLDTLLEYPEADAATGVYFTKTFPHRAVVGKYSPWSEKLEPKRAALASEGFIAPDGSQTLHFKHLQWFDVVQPVDVFGLGCVLMRTSIFEKIKQPYCRYVNMFSTGGDWTFDGHSEDMWFCSQLKQAGVKVLVNPKVQVGHIVEKVICGNEADQ